METTPTTSSRGWRISRRCLIGFAVFVTILAMIYVEQDVHGHFAWAATQRESAAKGLELNPDAFVPAPVPDDQNFAMTPFLAPLLDLNPDPLKPGQSRWRDANGYQKAMDFGKEFLEAYDSNRSRVDSADQPVPDLIALATAFHKKAKTPAPAYATRAEAAADLLRAFEPCAPVLDELRAASARPYSRFKVEYDNPNPAAILVPHLAIVKRVAQISSWRASAELALGKNAAAFNDLQLALSMADSLRGEPFMISHLVRIAILNIAHPVIWEGLATDAWSDQQLREIQDRLSKLTILSDQTLCTHYEVAAQGTRFFDLLRRKPEIADEIQMNGASLFLHLVPDGWFRLEQSSFVRMYSGLIATSEDPQAGVVHPKAIAAAQAKVNSLLGGTKISLLLHHRIISRVLTPDLVKFHVRSASSQTEVDETVIACALTRYRRANGQFPAALDALAPQFLAAVPRDVINGGPLKYQPVGPNQFLLYSVGWNETDDGGKIVFDSRTHRRDLTQGDWAWEVYPQK